MLSPRARARASALIAAATLALPARAGEQPAPPAPQPAPATAPATAPQPAPPAPQPAVAALRQEVQRERPPVFLAVGVLGSHVWSRADANALGVELTGVVWPYADELPLQIGGFVQAQAYAAAEGDHARIAGGPELGWAFGRFGVGLELGVAYRSATPVHVATVGAHVGPYLSWLGVVSLSPRFTLATVPVGSEGHPASQGDEVALALAIKWPFELQGNLRCERDPACHGGTARAGGWDAE